MCCNFCCCCDRPSRCQGDTARGVCTMPSCKRCTLYRSSVSCTLRTATMTPAVSEKGCPDLLLHAHRASSIRR